MGKVILDWDTARSFMEDAFKGVGVPADDAKIVVDVLLESDKRGIESHGCNRFKPIYIDRINDGIQNPVTNFEIIKETECTAVVDGHDGMGQVIGYKSMQMAIDKAKKLPLEALFVSEFQIRDNAAGRICAFSPDGRLIGREGATADIAHATYAFSGIAMVSPELFAMLPEADHPYPIIEEYIRLSTAGHRIGMFRHAADDWLDVGKPETLKQAQSWKLSFSK